MTTFREVKIKPQCGNKLKIDYMGCQAACKSSANYMEINDESPSSICLPVTLGEPLLQAFPVPYSSAGNANSDVGPPPTPPR